MPFTMPPTGNFFEQLVYALTAANLVFWTARIWGGPSHEASIQAAEWAFGSWLLTIFGLSVARWLARRRGLVETGELRQYRGPEGRP
jgi:hypothetical protein